MQNRLIAVVAGLSLAFAGACHLWSDNDRESQRLESALEQSEILSNEILTWRNQMSTTIPPSVVQTVESFKERASELSAEMDDLSNEMSDPGVPAVQQALETLAEFNTERFDTTSPSGRSTLMDQFCTAATAVKSAAERAQRS